jgi:hypothetical protein
MGRGRRVEAGVGRPVVGLGLICKIIFRGRRVWRDRKIGRGRRGAEAMELVQCTVEGALDAGFVARESLYGAGAGGVIEEGA